MRLALALVTTCLVATTAIASPSQELDEGRNKFRHNEFQDAYRVLNTLIYPTLRLAQTDELVEAYVMLGACLVETGRADDARVEFTHALQLQPDRSLTNIYSASAIKVFEETRAKLLADDKAAQAAKRLKEIADQYEALQRSTHFIEIHPYSRNFLPFGAGQFQNGTPVRGVLFAAGEAVTLATTIGSYFYLVNRFGLNGHIDTTDVATVRLAQRVVYLEVGTGIAFFALYAGGVIDSLVHYKPRANLEFDESLLPPELRKPAKPTKPAKTSLRDRIHLTPLLAPDAVGIGIGWEN